MITRAFAVAPLVLFFAFTMETAATEVDFVFEAAFPNLSQSSSNKHVAVRGDFAYVCSTGRTNHLAIVDISNPAKPALASTVRLPEAIDVALEGDFAFVAAGLAGLSIVNVSNPRSPALVTNYNTGGRALRVAVVNSLAYLAASNLVVIVDVSEPALPKTRFNWGMPRGCTAVAPYGHYVYVGGPAPGDLVVVEPQRALNGENAIVREIETGRTLIRDIQTHGGFAYIGAYEDLLVYSLADPAAPVLAGEASGPTSPQRIHVEPPLLYASEQGGLAVFDLAVPDWPPIIARYPGNGGHVGVAATPGHVILTDHGTGLTLLRKQRAYPKTLVSPFLTSPPVAESELAGSTLITMGPPYVYFTDLSDPMKPRISGINSAIPLRAGFSPSNSIAVLGDRVFVAGPTEAGLIALGQTNTAHLEKISHSFGPITSAEAKSNFVFAVAPQAGMLVFSILEDRIEVVGQKSGLGPMNKLDVAGNLAVIYGASTSLALVDISVPVDPRPIWVTNLTFSPQAALSESNLYIVDDKSRLTAYDLSDPSQPAPRGVAQLLPWSVQLHAAGNLVFAAHEIRGFEIFDFGYANKPKRIAGNLSPYALQLHPFGPYMIARGPGRLNVFDHPLLRRSRLTLARGPLGDGPLALDIHAPPDADGQLERTDSFDSWSPGPAFLPTTHQVLLPPANPREFFRLRLN